MITTALSLVLLAAPQDHWKTYRMGESGLNLSLPAEPKTTKTLEETQIHTEFKSVKFDLTVKQVSQDPGQLSAAYTEKFARLREQYGRKMTSILNESPVFEAAQFGASDSIGFVIEVDADGGKAFAWQKVRIDGLEYEINIQCDRRDQTVMEKILGSAQYKNPETNDFNISPLGATGLQSYIGVAFLPQTAEARETSTSVVLQSDNFPAMILATIWTSDEIDYENEAQLKKAMGVWISTFVQGAKSEFTFKSTKEEKQTVYEISGKILIQGAEVKLLGKAYARRDDAQAVIAVIDSRIEGAEEFAIKILKSVSQIPTAN
ncbi:MAG: hypothetical protein ACKVQS_10315 [Fimbriimonadaceae bacterium]